MSKINIQGTIDNITSKSNVYTPIVEAVVNSIDAIDQLKKQDGKIIISLIRNKELEFDDSRPPIHSITVEDNGIGFTQENRDSFDTFYSDMKKSAGGKGFGRFMFLKYFNNVEVESIYKNGEGYNLRKFSFGKQFDIIINETNVPSNAKASKSKLFLKNIKDINAFDKGIDTIARKLLDRLLIFFVNDKYRCPIIIIKEEDGTQQIILNDYLNEKKEIQLIDTQIIPVGSAITDKIEKFTVKTFKVFFAGNQKSRISLTAHNREVTETTLDSYIPEFEEDFFEEVEREKKRIKKNFIIKAYVLGAYLNRCVSLERETFNFAKEDADQLYPFSQIEIEKAVATQVKELFPEDVKIRSEKKSKRIVDYVNRSAPWHRAYLSNLDLNQLPVSFTDEKLESELNKAKFKLETETKSEIRKILSSDNDEEFDEKFNRVLSSITEIGKSDLAHYVCNRRMILQMFEDLLRRRGDGKANLEKELHQIIFPMGKDSKDLQYEEHNLWLLDERLVFSDYISSDRKIAKSKVPDEPDLLIFDQKKSFRGGENEFSNPLTIFEFKRPKRTTYSQDDDPVLQIGRYLKQIREGKYETPNGVEKIKVNNNTPVYGYVICDITDKIKEFADLHQMTISPDEEGYFGFHRGYHMYVEILSYKKLLKDASLRNKIFFKKLQLE